MKLKTDSFAFRFFALNLFAPIGIHILVALIDAVGPDLRHAITVLFVVGAINSINLTMAYFHTGWDRVGLLTITAFNVISVFAMGSLSFFTSLFGWVHLVPDIVDLFYKA